MRKNRLSIAMIPDGMEAHDAASRRRSAFVAAAREAFFANGYGGTAMSAIAARVGGSKTTLWSYFPSKQDLFVAVVDDVVADYAHAFDTLLDDDEEVAIVLRRFGDRMMEVVLSPPIIELQRMVIGEAGRFPELGTLFFERGPKPGKAKLSAYLARVMVGGRIRSGDPDLAARHFVAMCQSNCHRHRLLGIEGEVSRQAVEDDVRWATETFLSGWRHERIGDVGGVFA